MSDSTPAGPSVPSQPVRPQPPTESVRKSSGPKSDLPARLLTAAILAFYYGVPGALAYTAYYLSFFTGGLVIDRLRRHHRASSLQAFLRDRFGRAGPMVGVEHKCSKLLVICIVVLVTGFAAFGVGAVTLGRAAGSRQSTT